MAPRVPKGQPSFEWPYNNSQSTHQLELFMNKKKLDRLEEWFSSIIRGKASQDILLLTGPSGSGKTFTVHALARKYDILLKEAYDEKPVDSSKAHSKSKYRPLDFSGETLAHSIELYDNFSCSEFKSDSIPSILMSGSPCILIVTDPCSFEPALVTWLKQVLASPRVCHIETLPFPKTVMQKAVASYKENCANGDTVEGCHGDLRSALIALKMERISGKPFEQHDLFFQDHSLGLFHSLGKFIYPRKQKEPYDPAMLWPEDLGMFNLYLHHNMTPSVRRISSLSQVISALSQVDLLDASMKLPEHWKREYLAIPARVLSDIVTNSDRSGCGQIKMNRPQYLDLKFLDTKFTGKRPHLHSLH